MSLKDDILNSNKLSAPLISQINDLDDSTDPDAPLFSALVKLNSPRHLTVAGAVINYSGKGTICTANKISLNGLKNLIDSQQVDYVEGSVQLNLTKSKPFDLKPF